MKSMHRVRWLVAIGAVALLGGAFSGVASGSGSQANQRFIVVAKNAADYASLRARAVQSGARITKDLKRINSFAVWASPSLRRSLASDSRTAGIAADRLVKIAPPEAGKISMPTSLARQHAIRISAPASAAAAPAGKVRPDPAFRFHDAEWDYRRIGLPDAWGTTLGSPHVTVAVADTGLDYTHPELKGRISNVVDFTSQEFPPICKTLFGESDQDLAAQYGGPVDGDWNGHGSWIGGDIGGALDGTGINGIAPRVDLVSLKISQWCGYATDSELISAFLYAADHKYDAVSISFGGYLYRPDPGQDELYKQYVSAIAYGRSQGTVVVAAAGNEHLRVGRNGLVISHGSLTFPGDPLADFYGWTEVPGGVPGVVDVASTGNVVNATSPTCTSKELLIGTCKLSSDRHQPFGVGQENQLTYYSNYGPRIDIAAPGGARKFNVPNADQGGTPGFPFVKEGPWETFSITSNWAIYQQQIPCFYLNPPNFYGNACYSTIQGTSMATPHASAVLALIASAHPELRGNVDGLIAAMKAAATHPHNYTPRLSRTDKTKGDRVRIPCDTGYCHLGGAVVSDAEAYGAGLVSASAVG